jgi:hypothetical protein
MDDLVRDALREGRLTVAGGGPAALYTPWAAGFEKQYPGITVQVRGAFSNQLVADIDRQLESGAPTVDIAILQTLHRQNGRSIRLYARPSLRPLSRLPHHSRRVRADDGSGPTIASTSAKVMATSSRLVASPGSNWGVDGCEVGGLAVVAGEVYRARGVESVFQGSDG